MNDSQDGKFKIFNFKSPAIQTLHITWFAFFMTFVLWFSHAPMKAAISQSFDITGAQWKALLILNVALTIPARIVVGILVDKLGPRITSSRRASSVVSSPSHRATKCSPWPAS